MTGKVILDYNNGKVPEYLAQNKDLINKVVEIFKKKINGSKVEGIAVLCVSCPYCQGDEIQKLARETSENDGEFTLIFPFDFDENRGFVSDFGHTVRYNIAGFKDLDLFEKNLDQRFNGKSAV